MNLFTIARGIAGWTAGTGASIIVQKAINTVTPFTPDVEPRRWVRGFMGVGRYALSAVAADVARAQIQKEFDILKESADQIREVAQEVKDNVTFQDIAKRATDEDDKR